MTKSNSSERRQLRSCRTSDLRGRLSAHQIHSEPVRKPILFNFWLHKRHRRKSLKLTLRMPGFLLSVTAHGVHTHGCTARRVDVSVYAPSNLLAFTVYRDVLDDIENDNMVASVRLKVLELCRQFPVYQANAA